MSDLNNLSQKEIDDLFSIACYKGDVEQVKALLDPSLKHHAKIVKENGSTLSFACFHGHLDLVKYFLTDPTVKDQSDIRADGDNALSFAAIQDRIEVVKYLLTSPELTERPDNIEFAVKCAKSFDKPNMLNYLIFEYGIEFTPSLKKELKSDNAKDLISYKEIEAMFKLRDNPVKSVKNTI
jgi:ankyrin repeat protein